MNKSVKILLFFGITSLLFLFSCVKEKHYPVEPQIEYIGYYVMKDANNLDSLGKIAFSYTDGDGDLGLNPSDSIGEYRFNFFLDIYQVKNGAEEKISLPDSNVNFNGRLPNLTPDGVNKSISGTIERTLELYWLRLANISDTIFFKFYVKDRALNSSNVIQTPYYRFAK